MKRLATFVFLAFVASLPQALARSHAHSMLIGKWSVDVSRLPIPQDVRPKSVTIAFAEAADAQWTMRVDIVDASGAISHAGGTAALDGTPAPAEGAEADTAAFKMPEPNVLVVALAKGGIPGSTRIYATSTDGRAMVETAVYFDKRGAPIMRTNYFTRIN
jgi:hypothetical protein